MIQVPGTPNREGENDPSYPSASDLNGAYQWLGARFALLKAPGCRPLTVGRYSETMVANSVGVTRDLGVEKPVEVHIRQELNDGTIVDVITERDDAGGASVLHQMWSTLINYQLGSAGTRGMPWGDGPPPPEVVDRLDTNNPPEPTGACAVFVDDAEMAWEQITCPDIATGSPVTVCGGRVGTSLVAVAGPKPHLQNIVLQMWPTQSDHGQR